VFRVQKLEATERPWTYDVFHGDQLVARLGRRAASGPEAYGVQQVSSQGEHELRAASLRDARALAEETYTAEWRDGSHTVRGPVRDL
jgi:hypothetical protein